MISPHTQVFHKMPIFDQQAALHALREFAALVAPQEVFGEVGEGGKKEATGFASLRSPGAILKPEVIDKCNLIHIFNNAERVLRHIVTVLDRLEDSDVFAMICKGSCPLRDSESLTGIAEKSVKALSRLSLQEKRFETLCSERPSFYAHMECLSYFRDPYVAGVGGLEENFANKRMQQFFSLNAELKAWGKSEILQPTLLLFALVRGANNIFESRRLNRWMANFQNHHRMDSRHVQSGFNLLGSTARTALFGGKDHGFEDGAMAQDILRREIENVLADKEIWASIQPAIKTITSALIQNLDCYKTLSKLLLEATLADLVVSHLVVSDFCTNDKKMSEAQRAREAAYAHCLQEWTIHREGVLPSRIPAVMVRGERLIKLLAKLE